VVVLVLLFYCVSSLCSFHSTATLVLVSWSTSISKPDYKNHGIRMSGQPDYATREFVHGVATVTRPSTSSLATPAGSPAAGMANNGKEWGKRPSINPCHSTVPLGQGHVDGPILDYVPPTKVVHPWNRASHPVMYHDSPPPAYLPLPPDMKHHFQNTGMYTSDTGGEEDRRHFYANVMHRKVMPEKRGGAATKQGDLSGGGPLSFPFPRRIVHEVTPWYATDV
jgi:hypothetical protein